MPDNVIRQAARGHSPIRRDSGESAGGAPRVKPVRITVDLDPAIHRALKICVAEEGTDISTFTRQLIALALNDPTIRTTHTQQ